MFIVLQQKHVWVLLNVVCRGILTTLCIFFGLDSPVTPQDCRTVLPQFLFVLPYHIFGSRRSLHPGYGGIAWNAAGRSFPGQLFDVLLVLRLYLLRLHMHAQRRLEHNLFDVRFFLQEFCEFCRCCFLSRESNVWSCSWDSVSWIALVRLRCRLVAQIRCPIQDSHSLAKHTARIELCSLARPEPQTLFPEVLGKVTE